MSLHCPYRHTSFATWRLQTLRTLYQPTTETRVPHVPASFPQNPTASVRKQNYSADEEFRPWRGWKSDGSHGKPTEFQELPEYRGAYRRPRRKIGNFNPFTAQGVETLQNLASDVKKISETTHSQSQSQTQTQPSESGTTTAPEVKESPLLHRIKARSQRKIPRRPARKEEDEIYSNNPWAHLLASPLRHCSQSNARLPVALFTDFNTVRDPATDKIMIMPVNLADLDKLEAEITRESNRVVWKQIEKQWRPTRGERLVYAEERVKDQLETDDSITDEVSLQKAVGEVGEDKELTQKDLASDTSSDTMSFLEKMGKEWAIRNLYPTVRIFTNLNFMRLISHSVANLWLKKKHPSSQRPLSFNASSLFSYQTRERLKKAHHYEKNKSEVRHATGTPEEVPPSSESFDVSKIEWQEDLPDRLIQIMRKRILLCLEAVAKTLNGSKTKQKEARVVPRPIPKITGRFAVDRFGWFVSPKEDWIQMKVDSGKLRHGDVSGVKQVANDENQLSLKRSTYKSKSVVKSLDQMIKKPPSWLAGSILLHIGKSDIEQLLPSSSEATIAANPWSSGEPKPLVPPMIPISSDFSLPVFSLHHLFVAGQDLDPASISPALASDLNTLADIINTCPALRLGNNYSTATVVYSPLPDSPPVDSFCEDYLILVKPINGAQFSMIGELWRLWRYLGGRQLGALPSEEGTVD